MAPAGCRTHRHASHEPIIKHDHLIHQHISYHILAIPHHNMPCKNKLDVLYFVVANFTWPLWATSKSRSYLRIDLAHDATDGERCIKIKIIPTNTQDLI